MKKILLLSLVLLFSFQYVSAENSRPVTLEPQIEVVFNKITGKLEKKYGKKGTVEVIKSIEGKVLTIYEKKKISEKRKLILGSLLMLSREYIF
ncbi:MAG: hypothetical protein GY828_00145, partial [Candidatus Gracilibacteria bacterium]|nr:hypothetical protein [Candidatus Gracilibacteria bacterium]